MSSLWDSITPSVLTLAGTLYASNANTNAANTASAAALQGAQYTADAIREGNQVIRESSQAAQRTLQQQREQAAPATGYLRTVMANPTELTPLQAQQLEDLRRSTNNTLHSTSFAGSGRTGVSLLRKTESDFRNNAIAQNQGRADSAANTMFSSGANATTGIANSQANTGAAIAAGTSAAGKVSGDAIAKGGLYDAQSQIANGSLVGRAMGDITSSIANSQRESRYADRLSKIEKSLNLG